MPSFRHRVFLPEAIDAPDCDPDKLERSYRHLAIINGLLSRMAGLLRRYVLADAVRIGGPATVLEMGCGGGDVLARLARAARRRRLNFRLFGVDADPRAVAHARKVLAPFANASVEEGSIDDLARTPARADYVYCNQVLHHVPPDGVVPALQKLRAAARRRLLVGDLERSPAAYALFTLLAGVAFRGSFVFADGRLSIRKGFRVPELQAACTQAGFPSDARVARLAPWRVVIVAPGG